jgi:hypothetical protein
MAFINDITINLARGTAGLQQRSFRPLILQSGSGTGLDKYIITELTDLVDLGISTSSDVYKMAGAMFAQSPSVSDIMVAISNESDDDDALTALRQVDDNFYAITIPSRDNADLATVEAWASANKKFFFGCSATVNALDNPNPTDRAAYVIHNNQATDFPECAWVGQNIGKQPGSFTWKWKRPTGQNPSTFNSTQLNEIRTKNGNALQNQKGQTFFNEGKCRDGEFIDVIHSQDWIEDQLIIELLSQFINTEKIPMDNAGIAKIEAAVRAVLTRAGDVGIIARATDEADFEKSDDKFYMFTIEVPQRSQLATNDLINRDLKGIKFTLFLAGAIHKVEVNGLITV